MTKKSSVAEVEKKKYRDYISVADNFYNGAELAYEFQYYNAAGVLIVHAAIAYADAITIKRLGIKSRGDDHRELINLLQNTVGKESENKTALNKLAKIIEQKNLVSYSGDVYEKKDIEGLRKLIERFKTWAEKQITD
jgi:hypothetical protein